MKKSVAWRMAAEWLEESATSLNPDDLTPELAEIVKHIRSTVISSLMRRAKVIAQKERAVLDRARP